MFNKVVLEKKKKEKKKTNYPKQHTMTLNGMKIKLSGAKNQKLIGTDRIRRTLDESTLCGHRNRKHDQAMT